MAREGIFFGYHLSLNMEIKNPDPVYNVLLEGAGL